jgi:hypothetical protein
MRTFLIILLTMLTGVTTAHEYLNDFMGGNNQRVFAIDGTLGSMVAARQTTAVKYINQQGDLECHILFKVIDNEWRSLGDIGSINGGTSCPLMTGGTRPVRTVTAFGPDICIGGDFTNLGGVTGLNFFACYSETSGWYQPNGIGNGPNNAVYSLDSNGTNMLLGGLFTTVDAGATSARRVVMTDGLFWQPMYTDNQQTSDGVGSPVQSVKMTTSFMVFQQGNSTVTWNPSVPEFKVRGTHNGNAVDHPDIVINGSVLSVATKNATAVSGDPGGSISDFDLGQEDWTEFGMTQGVDTHFGQLEYGLGPLYSTGDFTAFDADAKGIAWYNGVGWEAAPDAALLGDLNTSQPIDMQQGDNQFCLLTQGIPTDSELFWNTQVCYNGSTWQGDNQAPVSNVIHTLGEYQNRIILGGDFESVGDKRSAYVAKLGLVNRWNAISQLSWTGPGQGSVSQLQAYNGLLYATGVFNMANGSPVDGIAVYDGANWAPVTTGLVAYDGLMTVWNNQLIIEGTHNGSAGPILAWNGAAISQAGNFTQGGNFTSLTTYQGDLVAGNLSAGTGRLYRYDGGSWQAFGGTMTGTPKALAVNGNDLYVAGQFSSACAGVDLVVVNNIYRWDGSACHALGSGVTSTAIIEGIEDLALHGANLYATGRFDVAGGVPVSSLAMWNGSQWQALGLGIMNDIDTGQGQSLWIKGDVLYVTGYFEQAGPYLSHNFAAIDLDGIFANGFD